MMVLDLKLTSLRLVELTVLILVLLDDGLGLTIFVYIIRNIFSLNPCSIG